MSHIPSAPQDFSFAPAGPLRLLPTVSFATRAAALAGAALPVAMLATLINKGQPTGIEHAAALNTTCCPDPNL